MGEKIDSKIQCDVHPQASATAGVNKQCNAVTQGWINQTAHLTNDSVLPVLLCKRGTLGLRRLPFVFLVALGLAILP